MGRREEKKGSANETTTTASIHSCTARCYHMSIPIRSTALLSTISIVDSGWEKSSTLASVPTAWSFESTMMAFLED